MISNDAMQARVHQVLAGNICSFRSVEHAGNEKHDACHDIKLTERSHEEVVARRNTDDLITAKLRKIE
jgi:hypothetical protein